MHGIVMHLGMTNFIYVEERQNILEWLNNYEFNNLITPGFVETDTYFINCDIYVFPSLMEGSSKSIYEAMNFSMPIICTYESGSVVEDNINGYIVEKQNLNF